MRGITALAAAALAATASAQYTVTLSSVDVRAAKDASPFLRGLDEDGPQTLVLLGEDLFISAEGTVKDDNGTFAPEGTPVTWSVVVEGRSYSQAPAFVGEKGAVTLYSESGFGDDINWVNVDNKGNAQISVLALGAEPADDNTAVVYAITNVQSIIPLLSLVVLALLSRNVYVAMFFGIWIGSLVIEGGNIVASFKQLFDRHIIPSVTDGYNFRTITFTLFLAGFIAMIKHSGGQEGFSNVVSKLARSPRSTQLAAVAAGVGLFFDDYSSALILGSSFKRLTDQYYVSREKLAFVVDSTSAPIASVAPISSWIAFELGRIKPELDQIRASSAFQESAQSLPGEYTVFLNTIPTRFYPWFMLVIQIVLILFGVEFGPMLYAERKTRVDRRLDGGDGATDLKLGGDITDPEADTPRRAWNFFVPLIFFITTLLTSMVNIGKEIIDEDNADAEYEGQKITYTARNIFGNTDSFYALIYSTMGASLFALIFYLIQPKRDGRMVCWTPSCALSAVDCRLKKIDDVAAQENLEVKEEVDAKVIAAGQAKTRPLMYFTEGINVWVEGFKNLVPAILILCLAFTIKSIVKGCATDRFFTAIILKGNVSAEYLPTIIFFTASLLSLCTGTSWGTMSIMFPLVSFATFEKSGGDQTLFTVALSSILAGAIFGDHCSVISDTTILSAIGSGCSIGTHFSTQMPYALWGATFSMIVGTLPAGAGANGTAMLFIGIIILSACTLAVGAPIVAKSGRLDRFSELYLFVTGNKSMQAFKDKCAVFAAENPEMVDMEVSDMIRAAVGCCLKGYRRAPVAMPAADPEVEPAAQSPANPMDV